MSPAATSLSFVARNHFEGSRGGRLASRRHAGLRQASHTWISYPIHHFRGRERQEGEFRKAPALRADDEKVAPTHAGSICATHSIRQDRRWHESLSQEHLHPWGRAPAHRLPGQGVFSRK